MAKLKERTPQNLITSCAKYEGEGGPEKASISPNISGWPPRSPGCLVTLLLVWCVASLALVTAKHYGVRKATKGAIEVSELINPYRGMLAKSVFFQLMVNYIATILITQLHEDCVVQYVAN